MGKYANGVIIVFIIAIFVGVFAKIFYDLEHATPQRDVTRPPAQSPR